MTFRGNVDELLDEPNNGHDNGKIGEELIKLCCYRNPSLALSFLSDLHNRYIESDINAFVNHCNDHKGGISPLISACERSPSPHVVQQLLYYGANPQQRDKENRTPIYYTFMRVLSRPVVPCESSLSQIRHSIATAKQIIYLLLEYGCSPSSHDISFLWYALLQHATILEDIRSQVMLELFPPLFELDLVSPNAEHMQYSILSLFSNQGCVSIVKDFLSRGADVFWRHSETKETALHHAAQRLKNSMVIQLILEFIGSSEERKSFVCLANKAGITAVHVAAKHSSPENLHCFLSFYPDLLFYNDMNGLSVLQHALNCASPTNVREVLSVLLKRSNFYTKEENSCLRSNVISSTECTLSYSFDLLSSCPYNIYWKEQAKILQYIIEHFLYFHNNFTANSKISTLIDISNWSFIDLNRVSNIAPDNDVKIEAEKWANLLCCWLFILDNKFLVHEFDSQSSSDRVGESHPFSTINFERIGSLISVLRHCQGILINEYHIPMEIFFRDTRETRDTITMASGEMDFQGNCVQCCHLM